MKTAAEYRKENQELMQEYENCARQWLKKDDKHNIADRIPFFRDGVTNPDVWFAEGNDFRPLFILKEVSIGKKDVCELSDFLHTWGNKTCFDFVEYPFDDVKVGTFPQWKRIAHLAKGLEYVYKNNSIPKYKFCDLDYKAGDYVYSGAIPGYNTEKHKTVTANQDYIDIINKIAILELKKIGGGTTVGTGISLATKHYTEHIEPFKGLLIRQINLIEPTVIICLGRQDGKCISHLLKDIRAEYNNIPWIDGYHHQYSSNEKFYDTPLKEYQKHIHP